MAKKEYKYRQMANKIQYYEDEIAKRDEEIDQKMKQLAKMAAQNDDLKKEIRDLNKKLKTIQNTTIRELNNKLKEKDVEIDVLKGMIKSIQTQNKGKDNEIMHLKKRIERMIKEGYIEKMGVPPSPLAKMNHYKTQLDGDSSISGNNHNFEFKSNQKLGGKQYKMNNMTEIIPGGTVDEEDLEKTHNFGNNTLDDAAGY